MRIATIDLGTNTCHLLIIEIKNSLQRKIYDETNPVKLGEDGITKGQISNAAINRTESVFQKYYSICQSYKVEKLYATATAAVRQASNQKIITDKVKNVTGIEINIIDGKTEAQLIYEGVKLALPAKSESALIMDIGGGSVEFIITSGNNAIWKKSFPTGAAYLLEKFVASDPFTPHDITQIKKFLSVSWKELNSVFTNYNPSAFIGASGSFQTICDLYHKEIDSVSINHTLSKAEFEQTAMQLLQSNKDARLKMPGMRAMRADMIVYAVIMITFVLNNRDFDEIHYSNYALKEGLCNLIIFNPAHEIVSNLQFIKP